jgi:hypothetical protein
MWTSLRGFEVLGLRTIPTILSITGISAFYCLSRRILSERSALLANVLVGFNFFAIQLTAEIKPYGMELLVSSVLLYFLHLTRQGRGTRWSWIVFGLIPFFSLSSVFLMAGLTAAYLIGTRRLLPISILVAYGSGFLLGFAFASSQLTPDGHLFMTSYWFGEDPVTLREVLTLALIPIRTMTSYDKIVAFLVAPFLLLGIIISAWRLRSGGLIPILVTGLVAAWLLLLVASLLRQFPMNCRLQLGLVPFLAIATTEGIRCCFSQLQARKVAWLGIALFSIVLSFYTWKGLTAPAGRDNRSSVDLAVASGTPIYVVGASLPQVLYNARLLGVSADRFTPEDGPLWDPDIRKIPSHRIVAGGVLPAALKKAATIPEVALAEHARLGQPENFVILYDDLGRSGAKVLTEGLTPSGFVVERKVETTGLNAIWLSRSGTEALD